MPMHHCSQLLYFGAVPYCAISILDAFKTRKKISCLPDLIFQALLFQDKITLFIHLHCASAVITVYASKADHGKIEVRIIVYTVKTQAICRLVI